MPRPKSLRIEKFVMAKNSCFLKKFCIRIKICRHLELRRASLALSLQFSPWIFLALGLMKWWNAKDQCSLLLISQNLVKTLETSCQFENLIFPSSNIFGSELYEALCEEGVIFFAALVYSSRHVLRRPCFNWSRCFEETVPLLAVRITPKAFPSGYNVTVITKPSFTVVIGSSRFASCLLCGLPQFLKKVTGTSSKWCLESLQKVVHETCVIQASQCWGKRWIFWRLLAKTAMLGEFVREPFGSLLRRISPWVRNASQYCPFLVAGLRKSLTALAELEKWKGWAKDWADKAARP